MSDTTKTFWKQYKDEVKLRAENNYGDFGTGEEIDVNVNQAIDEIARETKKALQNSEEAERMKADIRYDYKIL